jgi:hypothetical protein
MDRIHLKPEPIKTILVVTVGFLVVYFVTKWQWAINISVIVGIFGLLSDFIAKKINFAWIKTTWILSLIVPNILLSLTYFLFLIPLAYLSKIFGVPNQLTLKNTEQSLFKERNKDFNKDSFENTW